MGSKRGEKSSVAVHQRSMPLPPKYQPKVTVRVTCGRTKGVGEFSVELPIDGESEAALNQSLEKLRDLFGRLGIFGHDSWKEKVNAQRNLRPEESEAS